MTATQVFFRFAKENGYYGILHKCACEAFSNIKKFRKIDKYDSLVKMHGNKVFVVDILLKELRFSLSNFIYILQCNSKSFQGGRYFQNVNEKWSKYLRENLNGGYYKTLITDSTDEFMRRYEGWGKYKCRNGHYAVNYTLRENKK